jgi:O-antigen ligase
MAAARHPGLKREPRPEAAGSGTRKVLTAGLLLLLCGGILTVWVPDRLPLGIFQAGVDLLAILAIVHILARRAQLRGSPLLFPLAGVLVLGAVQIGARLTSYPAATRASLLAWTTNTALVFLTARIFVGKRDRRRFLRLLFYFGFAVSIIALAQLWTSHGKVFWLFPTGYTDFVMGPFVSRNLYSAFIELLLPIGLFLALTGGRPWAHAAMCGIMLASVIAGASRAGAVLTAAEVVAVLLVARAKGRVDTRGMVSVAARFAVGCAIFAALFGGTEIWHRLAERDPYGARREMLLASADMVRERPWSGFGLGTWAVQYPRFALYDEGTVTGHAHNDWVEWAAEGGVPLALLTVWIAALTVRGAVDSLWGIGVLAVWMHSLVDAPMQNPIIAAWVFLMAGLLAARSRGRAAPIEKRGPVLQ